ncbi:flagellar brake protein [Paenibacillus sp. PDC88]|uniref:flagellar brake protein n=1 Tax=Paenibacillus TaxID=44249 RepID=UPI000895D638|nr:PilZ domain-containing protein [Paenibacillus sp. PDC88]SDX83306.1 c-di-GMP-binding flagellar brake protein YcgR, contains PilZNR and PilZ domains [Paenibacillus sp. PDC88]
MEFPDGVELWEGQLLELHTLEREIFQTLILKIDNQFLYIQRPINQQKMYMQVTNGMPVTVFFHNNSLGLFTFDATIRLYQNQVAIRIPPAGSIQKAQRRRFFRVPVETELELVLDPAEKANQHETIKLTTRDISGGGVSFHFPNPMENGILVRGTLHLKTNNFEKAVSFHGKIVNCMKQSDHLYRISLEFLNMNESVRSDIIRYCMLKQIEIRNKLKDYPV